MGINFENLEILEKGLRKVNTKRFDLYYWRVGKGRNVDMFIPDGHLLNPRCRSTGCAIGWACAMPEFREQGLWFDPSNFKPRYNGSVGFGACMELFNISLSQAYYLFALYSYEAGQGTLENVITRIHEFICNERIKEQANG